MTAIASGYFPAQPRADRQAFLLFTALVWLGVLSGFGTDSFRHLRKFGLDYPWIVHVHAVAFVGYLVLFTTQVALIRNGRPDIHRKLGIAGAALAVVMLVLGPAAAIVVHGIRYAATGDTPEFLAVQLTDMLGFAGLTGAGLLLRKTSSAHKRLMLMGLIYISDAGFGRFLNGFAAAPLGDGLAGTAVAVYLGSDLLMLGLGAYDLLTRGRLHSAYIAGLAWVLLLQATALSLLPNAAWKALTLHMIGH
ncbi:hypothetical protein EJMOOK_08090 [Rhodanobacter sp. Root179]|nr:hypothetical protein ASD82_16825 [Rhodanobacter sp. Root179]